MLRALEFQKLESQRQLWISLMFSPVVARSFFMTSLCVEEMQPAIQNRLATEPLPRFS